MTDFRKYIEQGAYHWKRTIGAETLRALDPRLMARYRNALHLINPAPGMRILDSGCGEGVAAMMCSKSGADVIGIDAELSAVTLAKRISAGAGAAGGMRSFIVASVYDTGFPSATFDGVLSLEVIEHLDRANDFIAEAWRVLKPGGRLVISTPKRREDGRLQDPYHVLEYSAESLAAVLGIRFSAVEVFGAWHPVHDALYQFRASRRLGKYLVRPLYRILTKLSCSPLRLTRMTAGNTKILMALARK